MRRTFGIRIAMGPMGKCKCCSREQVGMRKITRACYRPDSAKLGAAIAGCDFWMFWLPGLPCLHQSKTYRGRRRYSQGGVTLTWRSGAWGTRHAVRTATCGPGVTRHGENWKDSRCKCGGLLGAPSFNRMRRG